MNSKLNLQIMVNTTSTSYIYLMFLFIMVGSLSAQSASTMDVPNVPQYNVSSERYFTNGSGIILMNVNVWGHVSSPGRHAVFDGIDLATLLSVVGGPKNGANLEKVKLFREVPDDNGQQVYTIDLKKFLKTGDRSGFMKILPNDTFIIPQTTTNVILSNVGTLNTFLTLLNLYLQIMQFQIEKSG